jgi:hypothetical protein
VHERGRGLCTVLSALARLEAHIDFPEEDLPSNLLQQVQGLASNLALEIGAHLADNRRGERLREGRLLFAQLRCAACHDGGPLLPPKGEGMPELAQDAPLLGEFRANNRGSQLDIDVGNGLQHTFASEPFRVAVSKLDGLFLAGRGSRRHNGRGGGSVIEDDRGLDCGVAA